MSVTPSSASKLPASDYVIFGGTGDLSFRKIFPAFFWRYLDGQLAGVRNRQWKTGWPTKLFVARMGSRQLARHRLENRSNRRNRISKG
jgi:glucose-6-phosphate 1-dehydrogenase